MASKEFHKHLLSAGVSSGVPVLLIVPDRRGADTYIRELAVRPSDVSDYSDLSFSIEGTPTIITVSSGVVKHVWVGQLSSDREAEVVHIIERGADSENARSATTSKNDSSFVSEDLDRLTKAETFDIIDTRDRTKAAGNSRDVLNIPSQEIHYRAPYELSRQRLHLVDCSNITAQSCDIAASLLRKEEFRVGTLNRGRYQSSICQVTTLRN